MRADVLERFKASFQAPTADDAEREFAKCAGSDVSAATELFKAIADDLDPGQLGIGWWAPSAPEKLRILVGDYLLQCAQSIQPNATEAALHLLAAEAAFDQFAARNARVVDSNGQVELPRFECAADMLPEKSLDLHLVGAFRAFGSAFDCLAGAIVGVLALKDRILKTDLPRVLELADKLLKDGTPGRNLQLNTLDEIQNAIDAAGPQGWLDWAMDYRNMFVHRGRRIQLHVLQTTAHIVDAQGRRVPKTTPATVLAREPGRSDVEALYDTVSSGKVLHVLTEDALTTVRELLASTIFVLRRSCELLLTAWRTRRASPPLLTQPAEQWPRFPSTPTRGFGGYSPESVKLDPTALIMGPLGARRLQSAALSTVQFSRWKTFA